MSCVTNSGLPIAAMRMSACFVMLAKFSVPEWHTVTVPFAPAFFCIAKSATGFPTIKERPKTTTCLPFILTFERLSSSIIPAGVQETKPESSS